LIIAAASRRQHHDFTERDPRVLGKVRRVLSVAGGCERLVRWRAEESSH
jgi:hypothetical protein